MKKNIFLATKQSIFFVKILLFILITNACSSVPLVKRNVAGAQELYGLDTVEVLEPEAIDKWVDPKYETGQKVPLDQVEVTSIPASCKDQMLYPTHPQQDTKIYHVYRSARYDLKKLEPAPSASNVCMKSNKAAKKFCTIADTYQYVVMSDTFQDGCGNLYRGVWNFGFLKRDESMGTLFSKGRTMYQKPNSEFENDMYVAQTYSLEHKDFLFLTPLFDGDDVKIKKQIEKALKTHKYDLKTKLFSVEK